MTELDIHEQAKAKLLERLCLMDDRFMTVCFEGSIPCTELVLQIILNKPDLTVISVNTQVFMANLLNRSVQLDILAVDSEGRKYNIEIQRSDKGAGKRRARLNCSLIDAKFTETGTDPDELPETFVIFITEYDVLGKGLPLYRVERCILDCGELFNDGTHILYVNGSWRDDSPLGRLMHDFSCTDAEKMYYTELAERMRFFKESKEGFESMSSVFDEIREEGWRKGSQETAISIAKKLLAANALPVLQIAEFSGLPLEQVQKLEKSLKCP